MDHRTLLIGVTWFDVSLLLSVHDISASQLVTGTRQANCLRVAPSSGSDLMAACVQRF